MVSTKQGKPLFMRLYCISLTLACEVYLGNMGLNDLDQHLGSRKINAMGLVCDVIIEVALARICTSSNTAH
jgi:hypothetical protein